MTLIAKTIVPDQFWVVVGDTGKVGNIDRHDHGYTVKINGSEHYYSSKSDLLHDFSIIMDSGQLNLHRDLYTDLPTDGEVHNKVIDIKRRLYIYTKTTDSRCYYASGWFAMKADAGWDIEFCPKYIFLQRREYLGPFHTRAETERAIQFELNNAA